MHALLGFIGSIVLLITIVGVLMFVFGRIDMDGDD